MIYGRGCTILSFLEFQFFPEENFVSAVLIDTAIFSSGKSSLLSRRNENILPPSSFNSAAMLKGVASLSPGKGKGGLGVSTEGEPRMLGDERRRVDA